MKNNTPSIIFMFIFLFIGFTSCTKEMEIAPNSPVEKQLAQGKNEVTIFMQINEDEVLVGTEGAFYAFLSSPGGDINCGTVSLQKLNTKNNKWEAVQGAQELSIEYGYATYSIAESQHADSGDYRWLFNSKGPCAFKTSTSGSLALVVVDEKTEEEYPWE